MIIEWEYGEYKHGKACTIMINILNTIVRILTSAAILAVMPLRLITQSMKNTLRAAKRKLDAQEAREETAHEAETAAKTEEA